MKLEGRIQRLKIWLKLFAFYFLLFNCIGCETIARKFTRKSKQEHKEEMVLAPEVYKPPEISKEELYRQRFLFWKSWHDELINALYNRLSQKKQLDCLREALKSLQELRPLLAAEKQQVLDKYLSELNELDNSIKVDAYSFKADLHRYRAERLKRDILRDLSYPKVKKNLV
jgi:hypothetical protein